MDKSALVETLMVSEKNHSIVKIVNTKKPVIGAVQKILNHVIILKAVSSGTITLTLGDIESVGRPAESKAGKLTEMIRRMFR